jgi:hypothetical protein
LAAALLLCSFIYSYAAERPGVLLYGATLTDARSFAVETAFSRGWTIRSVGPMTAVFEQTLEGEAEDDGSEVAERLLRVFAEFAEESSGVRVMLRAEEVELPDTPGERLSDVTARYTDNLSNALASLRNKWDAQRDRPAARSAPTAKMGTLNAESDAMNSNPIGAWAYAAEQYAKSRGCELGERPTLLEASEHDWERHRVFCQNGREMLVQCRYGDCTTNP